INLLALAMPIATMNIFDRVLTNNASETLMVLVIGVAVALGLDFALRGLRAAILDRATAGNDITALTRVFARLVDAKPGATSVGNRTNALREYEGLREYFNASALASLGDLPFLVIFLGVLHWIAGSLVWIPIASGAALLCVIVCVQLRVRKLVEQQFAASATKNTVATELLAAIPTLQLAGAKRWARQKWERAAGDQLRQSIKLRFWTSFSTHLLVMFQGGTTIAILAVGAGAVMAENLSPGALFAANLLAARCLAPIAGIAGLGARFSQMRLSHNQIVDILQTPAETEDKANIVVPSRVRSLSMQTVSHRYSLEAPEALSRVDLTFNEGEWVAIIGAIGSGKSTLLDVLAARLQPTEGTAKADAFSLSEIDPGSWRAQVGFVPQNPAFFAGTLRENICLGRGFSDEAVVRAINLAGAGNWVDRSGKGLDMTIGERGHGLSGGQLQSLALARALVGDPDWLIMDEPTNNLDGQSESRVLNALSALKGKTALIAVTHRPALVESADRLVVMDEGKVKLDGPRADVLERLRQAVAEGTTELQPDAPTQAPAKTTIKVG
ncbi:MAG: ATP-binding cassette domain-containing protein, partial [Pseudomonadota bacterium]